MSRVCTYSAALAVGARSRSLEDLARMAPGRAVWRTTERDLQVVEEESVVFSNIEVRVKRAGPSGLGDLEVTEYITHICSGRSRKRTAHPSTRQRPKHSCLTNSSLHCFIVPLIC